MENQRQEVSSSRLRTMLVIADRRIEKSRDRLEAVAMSNRLRDRSNEYVHRYKEVAFELQQMRKSYLPLVKVEVVGFDDGMWTYKVSAELPERGMSGPFSNDVRPSKREAARAGAGCALRFMLQQKKRDDGGVMVKRECKRAITELKAFLTQKVQGTLF